MLFRAGRWLLVGPFLYGITAFPLTIAGRARRAAENRRRWLGPREPGVTCRQAVPPADGATGGSNDDGGSDPRGRSGGRRRLGLRLVPLLPSTLVTFLLSLLIAYLVWAGQLYPLRPHTFGALAHPLEPVFGPGTWGGPTLVGAWAVHALVAFGLQIVAGLVIRGLAVLDRVLTEPRPGA